MDESHAEVAYDEWYGDWRALAVAAICVAGFGACSALLFGADDSKEVAVAAATTTAVSVSIPPLIFFGGVPLYRSWLSYTDFAADNPVQGAILFWSALIGLAVSLCACIACFCCG